MNPKEKEQVRAGHLAQLVMARQDKQKSSLGLALTKALAQLEKALYVK